MHVHSNACWHHVASSRGLRDGVNVLWRLRCRACAFGSRPVLMTYDGEFVDTATISVTKPLHLVIVDL